jgi:hypothetical protein
VPVRADLTGALTGWYRLHRGGAALPPALPLGDLDPADELVLHFVPNRVVFVDLTVEHGDPRPRLLTRMGTAVPVVTLVDHLGAWLGLPGGRWRLWLDDQLLDPHAILEDLLGGAADARPRLRLAAEVAARREGP